MHQMHPTPSSWLSELTGTKGRGFDELWTVVEPVSIARRQYDRATVCSDRAPDLFQIVHCLSGRGQALVGREKRPTAPGLTALVPPGLTHQFLAVEPIATVEFRFRVRGSLGPRLERAAGFVSDGTGEIARILEQIRAEAESRPFGFEALCRARALELLVILIRGSQYGGPSASAAAVPVQVRGAVAKAMVSYIDAHIEEPLRITSICKALGFSERYLRNQFRREIPEPIHRYILRRRVARAQQLIAGSLHPLKQIADLAGFSDVAHFSRVFTAVTGVSPRTFRDEICLGVGKELFLDDV
jgi:AraC-like DNA-binding protein